MVKAYPGYLRKLDCGNVVVRANKKEGKVALISGGGKRARTGSRRIRGMRHAGRGCGRRSVYIAYPDQIYEGIKAIATDAGVLMVVKNYTGDVMNFEMAAEMAEMEGITVKYVVTNDDVAVRTVCTQWDAEVWPEPCLYIRSQAPWRRQGLPWTRSMRWRRR